MANYNKKELKKKYKTKMKKTKTKMKNKELREMANYD